MKTGDPKYWSLMTAILLDTESNRSKGDMNKAWALPSRNVVLRNEGLEGKRV